MNRTAIIGLVACMGVASALQVELRDVDGRSASFDNIEIVDGVVSATDTSGRLVKFPIWRLRPESRVEAIYEFSEKVEERAKIEAAKPKGIVVSSLAVKHVKESLFGADYRYFFAVRNHGSESWKGKISIQLVSSNGTKGKVGTFNVEVAAGRSAWSSFDAATGPGRDHGDYRTAGFTAKLMPSGGKPQEIPQSPISEKYSDPIALAKALELIEVLEEAD